MAFTHSYSNSRSSVGVETPFGIIAVAAIYGLAAYVSVAFASDNDRIAALWLGNALIIGLLIQRSTRCQFSIITLCIVANFAANMANQDTLVVAGGLALTNGLQTIISLALIERIFRHQALNFHSLEQIGLTALIGAGVPALTGVMAAGVLYYSGDARFVGSWPQFSNNWWRWFAAHGTAIPIFTSMVLIARNFRKFSSVSARDLGSHWLPVGAAFVVTVVAVLLPA